MEVKTFYINKEDYSERFKRLVDEHNSQEFTPATEENIRHIKWLKDEIIELMKMFPDLPKVVLKEYGFIVTTVIQEHTPI